jgi:transposase InsO family protein
LQQRVHTEVQQTRERSRWPVRRTLAALGVSRSSYYRWLREEAWTRLVEPVRLAPVHEALPAEKAAVLDYARKHGELRHRELAWRMVDEDVAYVSPSTVYRILQEADLLCRWRRRAKRRRTAAEKPTRPDERWVTDLMHLQVGGRPYYLVCFLDEYSRYIVHHEVLTSMDGHSVSLAAQAAIDRLPQGVDGRPAVRPVIQSDNGSGYVCREFATVLTENGLGHHRITPHCPEENGVMERAYRTMRESLEGEELLHPFQARDTLERIVTWYNTERLHSALGFLRPVDYYRGDPMTQHAERRRKLVEARHRRREENLKMRQRTIPFPTEDLVSSR